MSLLSIARFTSASTASWIWTREPSYSFEGPPTNVLQFQRRMPHYYSTPCGARLHFLLAETKWTPSGGSSLPSPESPRKWPFHRTQSLAWTHWLSNRLFCRDLPTQQCGTMTFFAWRSFLHSRPTPSRVLGARSPDALSSLLPNPWAHPIRLARAKQTLMLPRAFILAVYFCWTPAQSVI